VQGRVYRLSEGNDLVEELNVFVRVVWLIVQVLVLMLLLGRRGRKPDPAVLEGQ